ncbi:MAG: DUF262 domain-containing protein [Bacteroidales bacterium]
MDNTFNVDLFRQSGICYTSDNKTVKLFHELKIDDKHYLICIVEDLYDNGTDTCVIYNIDGTLLTLAREYTPRVKKAKTDTEVIAVIGNLLYKGEAYNPETDKYNLSKGFSVLSNNRPSRAVLHIKDVEFNLSKKDIKVSVVSMHSHLGEMFDEWDELDFDIPLSNGKNLQRGLVWTKEQKSMFIKNILAKNLTQLQFVYIVSKRGYRDRKIQVVDGKQRINTLRHFVNGEFPVEIDSVEYYFSDLTFMLKYNILNVHMTATVFYEYPNDPLTTLSDAEKVAIFEHINFSGTQQDIEHLKYIKDGL